jgi:hypothetical protein
MEGERKEGQSRFEAVQGFTAVENFREEKGAVTTLDQYEAQGLTGAEVGKWAQNNGTIALIASDRRVYVWRPMENPNTPRTVSYEQAINKLKAAGYKEGNFYVPLSN